MTPEHGRRGVGRALVDEVVAWTAAQDLPSVTLTTFRDVPWNGPYYEKLGFQVVTTLTPALQALIDEQATWGLDPSLRVVMRRTTTWTGAARRPVPRAFHVMSKGRGGGGCERATGRRWNDVSRRRRVCPLLPAPFDMTWNRGRTAASSGGMARTWPTDLALAGRAVVTLARSPEGTETVWPDCRRCRSSVTSSSPSTRTASPEIEATDAIPERLLKRAADVGAYRLTLPPEHGGFGPPAARVPALPRGGGHGPRARAACSSTSPTASGARWRSSVTRGSRP